MVETVVGKLVALEQTALGTPAVLVYPPLDCRTVTKIHSRDHQHTLGISCKFGLQHHSCSSSSEGRGPQLRRGQAEQLKGGSRDPGWEGSSGA